MLSRDCHRRRPRVFACALPKNVCDEPSADDHQPIMKSYDRAYFERWYRDPTHRVSTRESLERKARMAISVTEFLTGRRVETIVDVGCGEAPWFPVVRRLRPDASYIGIDSSE